MNKLLSIVLIILISSQVKSYSVVAMTTNSEKKDDPKETVQKEIKNTLEQWNKATSMRDIEKFMELLDNTPEIMIIGSDSGEIFKGREQIETWIKKLFVHNGFLWEMDRVDIDFNGNTAWVFVDGTEVITTDKGEVYRNPYRFTGILVKNQDKWKWRFFDGSYPSMTK